MGFDENTSFNELLDVSEEQLTRNEFHIDSLLEAGFYSKQIKRFQKIFPKNQIKIIIFEEYIKNTIPTINSILSFLDTDKSIAFKTAPKGAYKVPRNFASQKLMNNSMGILNPREKEILIARRLSEDIMTLEDLSKRYKVSRERIRQIETKAFEKLQKAMLNAAKSNNLLPRN